MNIQAGDRLGFSVSTIKVQSKKMQNYCYVLLNHTFQYQILIDPAFEKEKIQAVLNESDYPLRAVCVTHGHFDHVHLAEDFSQSCAVPVAVSLADYQDFNLQMDHVCYLEASSALWEKLPGIQCIHTPGHTRGSYCFIAGDNIFTGDSLFAEGCGMCFGETSDAMLLYQSLQILKRNLSPHSRVYPGHSYGKAVGQYFADMLKTNIYLNFDSPDQFVKYRLRKNQNNYFEFQ